MSILKEAVDHLSESDPMTNFAFSVGVAGAILEMKGDISPEINTFLDRAEELSMEFAGKMPQELFG